MQILIYFFHKYLLSTSDVPGIDLGTTETSGEKTPWGLSFKGLAVKEAHRKN